MRRVLVAALLFYFSQCVAYDFGPSFDCEKATTQAELTICSEPYRYVRVLDLFLSDVYKLALKQKNPNRIRKSQRDWLKVRDECSSRPLSYIEPYANNNFAECYVERINYFLNEEKVVLSDEFYEKYKGLIGFKVLGESATPADQFLYAKISRAAVEGIVYAGCFTEFEYVLLYDFPVLVSGSRGAHHCSGTSFPYRFETTYCETETGFIKKSMRDCVGGDFGEYIERVQTKSVKVLNTYPDSLAGRNKSGNLISRVLTSQIRYFIVDEMFSETGVKYVEKKFDSIKSTFNLSDSLVAELIDGMKCTLDSIENNENWEQVLNWPYMNNVWYATQFEGCQHLNEPVANNVLKYSYKDVYVLTWRRLLQNGGFVAAKRYVEALSSQQ